MTARPRRRWQDMTTAEFAALDAARTIAVLPVGAIEQHGPHLPVYVDACIAEGLIDRALELAPKDLPVTVLPTQPVGKSNEHISFPGTLTLSAETLTRLWTEIGDSVARAGIRKVMILNSHGGQPQVVDIVGRDLRVRHKMMVVALNWYRLGLPDGLFDQDEVAHGIHGGEIETSMMLHLRPDLVQMDKARDFTPLSKEMREDYRHLSPLGPAALAWQAEDLNPAGAAGNAAAGDAERGRRVVDFVAERIVEVWREFDRAPLDLLKGMA